MYYHPETYLSIRVTYMSRRFALPLLLLSFTSLSMLSSASLSLAIDTVWNFDGDLTAASGSSTMQYRGATAAMTSFGTTDSLGLPSIDGGDGTTNVMAFPTFPRIDTSSLGYSVLHGVGVKVPEYTMVWDVLYPESSDMHWRGLYQTNIANANDGDFFIVTCDAFGDPKLSQIDFVFVIVLV